MFGIETLTNKDIIISVLVITGVIMTAVIAFKEKSKITDQYEESMNVPGRQRAKKTRVSEAVFFFGLIGAFLLKAILPEIPSTQRLVMFAIIAVVAVTMIIRYREKNAISSSKDIDI